MNEEKTDKEQEAKKRKENSPDTSEKKNEGQFISKGYSAAPKIRPRGKPD